jgi:hypothetical protein
MHSPFGPEKVIHNATLLNDSYERESGLNAGIGVVQFATDDSLQENKTGDMT